MFLCLEKKVYSEYYREVMDDYGEELVNMFNKKKELTSKSRREIYDDILLSNLRLKEQLQEAFGEEDAHV